jgi:hypothetical protein
VNADVQETAERQPEEEYRRCQQGIHFCVVDASAVIMAVKHLTG